MRILTGIDLPFSPSCGSLILANDLYSSVSDHKVRFLALLPYSPQGWSGLEDLSLLAIKKEKDENIFFSYVASLHKEILKHVDEFKPDIIHIQHLSFGMALAFAKLDNVPKVAICHGTGVLFARNSRFHLDILKEVVSRTERIIFPSTGMYKDLKKIIEPKKAEIVPWGLPDAMMRSFKISQKQNRKGLNILYAGRLTKNKQLDLVIRAIYLLEETVSLTIIGEGEELENLMQLVNHLGLKRRIKFISFMSREDLWRSFKDFDVLVVCSQNIEAFCLVAIEAQAHGLPVIYARTGGLVDILGNTGLEFDANSYQDLADKINQVFMNKEVLHDLSNRGLRNARKYVISKTRERVLTISAEVINETNKSLG